MVVLELPTNVSKTMQADLLALINELTDLREEQEGIVDKITTGVGTGGSSMLIYLVKYTYGKKQCIHLKHS